MKPCSYELGESWRGEQDLRNISEILLTFLLRYLLDVSDIGLQNSNQWKIGIKYLSEPLDADFGLGIWNGRTWMRPICPPELLGGKFMKLIENF
ncbi:hypothetical protein RCL_jg4277.t1 [Rhizophagus clarus]|uniref:Uncharacterized protein n=1 Tax=Rhizophagus clarus TaxID=94130 RepID=A0A8H3QAW9_9GLOM|nr:hypothetical protein RCL_jg4277.t1 [Rhizophagus clarus]